MSAEIHQPKAESLIQPQMMENTPVSTMRDAVSAEEGIRQGLHDVTHGRTRPAREALDEFRQKHRIPR